MLWIRWFAKVLLATVVAVGVYYARICDDAAREIRQLEQARPAFGEMDVWNVALVLTFEAQVFPEPERSRAYRAIAWTVRNRVASGYDGATGYDDRERLLSHYLAFRDHRLDLPDPEATIVAGQVLGALTGEDDLTGGARHYVDNSYWTGTHAQTGPMPVKAGLKSDVQVQSLVDGGRFVLSVEWKSNPWHPKGLLFYGLYFFDYWPPPEPDDRW